MPLKCFAFLAFITITFLAGETMAIQTDTISIAMEPDSRECFEIRLPDDMGAILTGKIEYHVTVVPDSVESWLDLTELKIRTDENEAVGVPVCFSSVGKAVGNCSEPFTLTIKAIGSQLLPDKTIIGGACVSSTRDVDTAGSGAKGSGAVDVFDLALENALLYAKPGEPANYTIKLQSQMGVTVDVEVTSGGKSIVNKTVQFAQTNYTTATFTLKAAETGEYKFIVTGKVRGCRADLCSKSVSGTLVVTDQAVPETGFLVSLFPTNIDAKAMETVEFKATIQNNMPLSGKFTLLLKLPAGVSSDFTQKQTDVPANGKATVAFNVTPEKASSQFSLIINATSQSTGKSKVATSYLSTDEMLTEVQRLAETVGTKEASSIVDKYIEKYNEDETNLTAYEDAAITLDNMEPEENVTADGTDTPVDDGTDDTDGTPIWLYGIVAAGVVAVALVAYKLLGKKSGGLDQEFSLK